MDKRVIADRFLTEKIFYGLKNLNDGFDAPTIKYFSTNDFETVLQRIKELGLGVYGIEPWKNQEFYRVETFEQYTNDPTDYNWYLKAFEDFRKTDSTLK